MFACRQLSKMRVHDNLLDYPYRDLVAAAENTVAVLDRRREIASLDQGKHIPEMGCPNRLLERKHWPRAIPKLVGIAVGQDIEIVDTETCCHIATDAVLLPLARDTADTWLVADAEQSPVEQPDC